MRAAHTEATFEAEIAEHLAAHGWLYSPTDAGYDKDLALFPKDVRGWLADTQSDALARFVRPGDPMEKQEKDFAALLKRLVAAVDRPLDAGGGTLAVLRRGFRSISTQFDMCQFKPADSMNPTTLEWYGKVRLRVMRQVHYSVSRPNRSVDLVLFVNGLPVATIEVKTDFTQSVTHGQVQYAHSRQPTDPGTNRKEPLLAFGRTLVHFVVTNKVVSMTTRLQGAKTTFLPFNKGDGDRAGNPPDPTGSDTSYFWRDVLQRDVWLTILGKYMHVQTERKVDPATGEITTSTKMLFPRFHQLQVVEELVAAAHVEGPGHRYLVQHSAGSGKTNSIAWTAHRLAALHDERDRKVFDTVVVVTDRTVLDDQLSQAIFQIEHKRSQVYAVTNEHGAKSGQLAEALASRTPIITVTIQTFPFALEAIQTSQALRGRTFAVIADEAHSSQTGQAATKLKEVLSPEEIADLEDAGEVNVEDVLAAQMRQRAQPANISYFAFTATPKAKTMELFGRIPPGGTTPEPFHTYSMSQAIEEGFILDVLTNYTPYKTAFRLVHEGQNYDSENVDHSRALKSLMRWVRLHEHNISQKVAVIVEHYRTGVAHLLGGKAKAMVVTGSRKEAVRYHQALEKYIATKGYDLAALVAFSGTVEDPETLPEPVTEVSMNPGLRGRKVAEAFNGPEYQVLIVANKYQTGFDQPLLCAMYVDKRLSGVMAVQTLSRLNRTYPGKNSVYVLDFVNDPDDILAAFKPYYRQAALSDVSDANIVNDLADKLDHIGLYTDQEIDAAASATIARSNNGLAAAVSPAEHRFQELLDAAKRDSDREELERLEMFRSDLSSYVKAYEFLSQLIDYGDTLMEKRAIYYRALGQTLRDHNHVESVDLSNVVMTHYRLATTGEESVNLPGGDLTEGTELDPLRELGRGGLREPKIASWAEIIEQINDLFSGADLDKNDKYAIITHAVTTAEKDADLRAKAQNNTESDFYAAAPDLYKAFITALLQAGDKYDEGTEKLLEDTSRTKILTLLKQLDFYGRLRTENQVALPTERDRP